MNDISNIEIEPLEDEKIEEIETRLKVDDDKRWYAPVVRWIVNRYKASREREQDGIDQLKKCREENKMFRSVNVEFAEKWIERTKEACFEAGWKWIIAYFKGLPLSETNEYRQKSFKQAIDEAKVE